MSSKQELSFSDGDSCGSATSHRSSTLCPISASGGSPLMEISRLRGGAGDKPGSAACLVYYLWLRGTTVAARTAPSVLHLRGQRRSAPPEAAPSMWSGDTDLTAPSPDPNAGSPIRRSTAAEVVRSATVTACRTGGGR
ncbi:hypothetical protein OsJ_17644 [Oryza sativa Japonica Group]|uniref:Uncharacterized protein n=1 Tax=Oryza sativa subsp. japonica TaxID=39947 RepID=B9FN89_ORYSJ|nr:hypothetical protein OsJ_17644 [Oryza sativa Japonica Group]